MIALRTKTVTHTFLPSFNNANGRLCQEKLLRSRNFATMVTFRQTSPWRLVAQQRFVINWRNLNFPVVTFYLGFSRNGAPFADVLAVNLLIIFL